MFLTEIENVNLLSSIEILKIFSKDLEAIDISILETYVNVIDKTYPHSDFKSIENKYFELATLCKDKSYSHPEWSLLSGRIRMLYIKITIPSTFSEACEKLKPILDPEYFTFCTHPDNIELLNFIINPHLDWKFDIFAVETLLKGYLSRVKDDDGVSHLCETPQYMYLRIAVYLWFQNGHTTNKEREEMFENIKQTYKDFSEGKISGPSPLQFNAGTKRPQLSSCFLLNVSDSMGSISKSWHDSAIISKNNGGIGMDFSSLRHSEIGNHGWSQGIVPWAKIMNEILATVNQGGRRKGSGTMWITDWHADIFEFTDLKDPLGKDELRARDLFYGIMVSDLFMRRVRHDEMWSLMCPAKTKGLEKLYGIEFEKSYLELEKKGLEGKIPHSFRQVKARELWLHILRSQIKTGMPFILFKDSINRKSNQKNLGTIRMSNLCCEIVEYVDQDNIASCNLSSIPISRFVKYKTHEKILDPNFYNPYISNNVYFDFEELGQVTRRTLRNLAQMINRNYYPEEVPQIKYTNMRNRPIGVGIQDLAGCFAMMDLCWDSKEAKELNEKIARVMYYHGMDENVKMAREFGAYETFKGSPASEGFFQFDLWNVEESIKNSLSNTGIKNPEEHVNQKFEESSQNFKSSNIFINPDSDFNWDDLRSRMTIHGLYFSLVFSQMPTASSAQILGNNESIEPYTQLLYTRTVLSGQFVVSVPYLIKDLEQIGLWNDKMLRHLFNNQGSIQSFPEEDLKGSVAFRLRYLKKKYRTVFELSQKVSADLYISRAKYQCQTSSNNGFFPKPTPDIINAYLFYMWKMGAKTAIYYTRQPAGSDPLNFSLDSLHVANRKNKNMDSEDNEICVGCHS